MQKILKEFWGYLAIFVITCTPTILSRFTSHQANRIWYDALAKPFFVPPSWVFATVWPILYFLMATAAWIIWRKHHTFNNKALIWYYVQLAVNALWMPIFFGAKLLFTAMVWSYILTIVAAITAHQFLKVDKAAGNLLLPYVLWSGFASLMSTGIWILNT